MKETKQEYVKRTQRDYTMPFKMAVLRKWNAPESVFVQ